MPKKEFEELNFELDFEFVKGQWHYQQGGQKQDLSSKFAKAGYAQEKYMHEQKTNKAEWN